MGKTLREMANIYLGTYKLPDAGNMLHHDSIHAMTGLGIGIADEMRVIGIEVALKDTYNCDSSRMAIEKAAFTIDSVKYMMKEGMPDIRMRNGLETDKFKKIQYETVHLEDAEIEAYFKLGRQMFAAIKELTGKAYMQLSREELGAIDLSKVDFSAEATAIKERHMKPENRKVGILTARHLRAASKAQGGVQPGKGHSVPRSRSNWVHRVSTP